MHELHTKITKYSGSEDKLHHIEREIRGLTHLLDFGVVNWETGDCGAMEKSFDDEEEPPLQDLSESSYFRDTSEDQSTFTAKQKSKPCRQDHVYSKLSE